MDILYDLSEALIKDGDQSVIAQILGVELGEN